jgi:hypothetical protein
MDTNFKRHLIISFGIILGSALVAALALNWLSGSIAESSQKIVQDRSLIDQQNGALSALATLKAQAPQAAKYEVAMNKLLPTQDGLISFGQWLTAFATEHGVTATFFFQGTPVPPAGTTVGTAPFALTISGSLNGITTFLNDANTKATGFPFEINSFDMTNTNGSYQFSGHGNIFFRT